MRALIAGRDKIETPNLKGWLRHGDSSLATLRAGVTLDPALSEHNQLSQLNVLQQIEHIKSYPAVKERLAEGTLGVHGWWFDIARADVYAYRPNLNKFTIIDEEGAVTLLASLTHPLPKGK